MYISELRIRNFRNFLNARFSFEKGVNTLIGENGSGKTNALYALRLIIDDSLSRNVMNLRESDFCRALDSWHGHWIIIAADFSELDPSEGCQLLKHQTGHMDGTDTGTYTLFYRPKLDIREKLHDMSTECCERSEISDLLESLSVDDYEPVTTGRATADFLNDDLYLQLVGDLNNYNFPDPKDDDQYLMGVRMSAMHQEVTCTFAKALRDVVSDLRGYRSNPLLGLLRGMESTIEIEDANRITSSVANLNNDISSLKEVKQISQGIQNTLHGTVGHTYSPLVDIESNLPDVIDKILQRLTVKVGEDSSSSYRGDLSEQGLGGANLIYLALKLLEYEMKLSSDRVAHFLLIEEPEAHIHTHIQKTLFENQKLKRTQVIVSTHSTHISSASKISRINVLARKKEYAEVYQPSSGISPKELVRVERYLDAVRSTLLFAKGVILIEGDAELIMLPAMIRAVFGLSIDEIGISVITMGSAFFKHVALVFSDNRIRRRCAIITDLDTALMKLPDDQSTDTREQKHARVSQERGIQRLDSLKTFSKSNQWIEIFFNKYTFEVEFISSNNSREAIETVNEIYKQASKKKTIERELESDDLKVSGDAILRMANYVGKGWYALILSEKLHVDSFIPEYILRAVAFAAHTLSHDAIKRIGLYRIQDSLFNEELRKQFPKIAVLESMEPQNFVEIYKKTAPEDTLSLFISYLEEYQ